ncbi:hypothetical protein [Colwellia hornerae]|uniref:hypothetical protein n=1 Tax=Colwellia hornerae TaxID=89402 RepID=UPI001478D839|nr:hypothetical protein [Colwellia hornerae]
MASFFLTLPKVMLCCCEKNHNNLVLELSDNGTVNANNKVAFGSGLAGMND